jgi:hypothetical protein
MISLATNLAEVPLHRPASLKKSISSHVPVPDFRIIGEWRSFTESLFGGQNKQGNIIWLRDWPCKGC